MFAKKNKRRMPIVVGTSDKRPIKNRQFSAEQIVSSYFATKLPGVIKIYNNIYIWNEHESGVVHIDHIILTEHNIYIVETKDIFGYVLIESVKDDDWRIFLNPAYCLNDHSKDKWIYSPYKKNAIQIDYIKKLAGNQIDTSKIVNLSVLECGGALGCDLFNKLGNTIVTSVYCLDKNLSKYEKKTKRNSYDVQKAIKFFDQFVVISDEIKAHPYVSDDARQNFY